MKMRMFSMLLALCLLLSLTAPAVAMQPDDAAENVEAAALPAEEAPAENGEAEAFDAPETLAAGTEVTAERRSQVGTGMRNERIRTYNFPQGRVTDHRIGLTLYKIDSIMDGALDELIDALVTADQAEKLQSSKDM